MLTPEALKQRLQAIAPADFTPLPERGLRSLVDAMIANIGSTDPVLRDDLIYSAFYHWITQDRLPAPLLRKLFKSALDEQHLFYSIGDSGSDTDLHPQLLGPAAGAAARQSPPPPVPQTV